MQKVDELAGYPQTAQGAAAAPGEATKALGRRERFNGLADVAVRFRRSADGFHRLAVGGPQPAAADCPCGEGRNPLHVFVCEGRR
jgi:hypothetical protein